MKYISLVNDKVDISLDDLLTFYPSRPPLTYFDTVAHEHNYSVKNDPVNLAGQKVWYQIGIKTGVMVTFII